MVYQPKAKKVADAVAALRQARRDFEDAKRAINQNPMLSDLGKRQQIEALAAEHASRAYQLAKAAHVNAQTDAKALERELAAAHRKHRDSIDYNRVAIEQQRLRAVLAAPITPFSKDSEAARMARMYDEYKALGDASAVRALRLLGIEKLSATIDGDPTPASMAHRSLLRRLTEDEQNDVPDGWHEMKADADSLRFNASLLRGEALTTETAITGERSDPGFGHFSPWDQSLFGASASDNVRWANHPSDGPEAA